MQLSMLTEMVLRAAGCKKIKAGFAIIEWEKKGLEEFNVKFKKKTYKADQRKFLSQLRQIQKITNKKVNIKEPEKCQKKQKKT